MRKSVRVLWLTLALTIMMAMTASVASAGWDWDDSVKRGAPGKSGPVVPGGGIVTPSGWDWDE